MSLNDCDKANESRWWSGWSPSLISIFIAAMLAPGAGLASIAFDSPENGSGVEGEIFFEAFDGVSQSWIVDTGIKVKDLLTNPTAYDGWAVNLGIGSVSPYSAGSVAPMCVSGEPGCGLPALPNTAVWGVKGARDDGYFSLGNAGFDPQSPANLTGAVATAATTPDDAGVAGFDTLIGMVKNHAQSAWVKEFNTSGTAPNYPQNLFQSFTNVDDAYYMNLGPDWLASIGFSNDAPISTTSMPFYFLTSDGRSGVVGNHGQPIGTWTFSGNRLTFRTSCSLDGVTVSSGSKRGFYSVQTAATDAACQEKSQERTCTAGQLGGSADYQYAACQPDAAASCTLDGKTVAHGRSDVFFSVRTAANSAACQAASQSRTCNNGTLDGSPDYQYAACQPDAAASCTLDGKTVAHGRSDVFFSVRTAASQAACAAVSQQRTCNNGALDGAASYQYANCEITTPPPIPTPANCALPWGGTLASGGSVDVYPTAASTQCGNLKKVLTCSNGTLNGGGDAYKFQDCATKSLVLLTPNGGEILRAKVPQLIEWDTAGLSAKQRLNVYFSKNAGQKWKLLKKKLNPAKRLLVWKPAAGDVTQNGMVKICSVPAGDAGCVQSGQTFAIRR
jgi:hypothetical protein